MSSAGTGGEIHRGESLFIILSEVENISPAIVNDGKSTGRAFFQGDEIEITGAGFGRDQEISAAVRRYVDSGNFGNGRRKRNGGYSVAEFHVKFIDFPLSKTEFLKLIESRDRLGKIGRINGDCTATEQYQSQKPVLVHKDPFSFSVRYR